MKRAIRTLARGAICLALLAATTGCATPGGPGAFGQPASERAEINAVVTYDPSYASASIIVEGAVIGAAVGCGIGALITQSARGCGIGAAIGGGAGLLAGAALAEGNERQVVAEDKEDELYAALVQEGQDLRIYNERVERAVARLRADLSELERQRRDKQVSAEAYDARRASIRADSVLLVEHTKSQREEVEERNEKFEGYELSDRTREVQEINLAIVFENAELAQDFDRDLES